MTDCILWPGPFFGNGYGRTRGSKETRNKRAHRVAWEEANGPVPKGLLVLRRCDVRACINVEHLFIGTQKDNMDDMIAKGRKVVVRGEAHRVSHAHVGFGKTNPANHGNYQRGDDHWTRRRMKESAK